MLRFLELRLDNVVYRAGWAATRPQARQFVNHGHVEVNGKRVDIPSYRVRKDDKVTIREKARNGVTLQWNIDVLDRSKPPWLDQADDKFGVVVTSFRCVNRSISPFANSSSLSCTRNNPYPSIQVTPRAIRLGVVFEVPRRTHAGHSASDGRSDRRRSNNTQRFAIGPLERGLGHTIGNSLRRTLLSSIPGAAISQVRFDDALHEFDTIPGVAEDVTDMILALKDIVLRVHSEEPVTLRLDVRGPKDVTASDIHPHADVEVLNGELPIATLNGKAHLAIDITVEQGSGYVTADRTNDNETIGVIPIDSIYSPVRRVAFDVMPTVSISRPTSIVSRSTSSPMDRSHLAMPLHLPVRPCGRSCSWSRR